MAKNTKTTKKGTSKKRTSRGKKEKKPTGFYKGNEFWKIRSSHGRDKIFSTPEILWEEACKYFQWCVDNPEWKVEVVKGSLVNLPVKRVFTLEGLCLYLGISTSYFRAFKCEGRVNAEGFLTVIEQIQKTVYNQQFSGASSGFFNANIISRALGLVDKKDVTTNGEALPTPSYNVYTSAPPLASKEQDVDKSR